MSFLSALLGDKTRMIARERALPGRETAIPTEREHFVLRRSLHPPFPDGYEQAVFGMGCFWGAEKDFWSLPGVYVTAVGYAGGFTPNPTYEEVCSGSTGHAEVVLVVLNPLQTNFEAMLKAFWEGHDPTQQMRQGLDVGTQYRSAIYYSDDAQREAAERSRDLYQRQLAAGGYGTIVTQIEPAGPFYYAEGYHQQYLAKNPGGYCGHGGTGVACPVGVASAG